MAKSDRGRVTGPGRAGKIGASLEHGRGAGKKRGRAQGKGQRPGPGRGFDRDRRPRPQGRGGAGVIEGRRAVAEALAAGVPLKRAFVAASATGRDPKLTGLVGELEAAGVTVDEVPRERLDQLSSHGAHQGIVVRTAPFEYASLADVIKASGTGDALVVLLDHVTDEGNFGAIVRSAEIVGATGVVVPKARSARVGAGAYKTSAGAVMHLPIAQVPNMASAIDELKAAGFWVGGATEHATDLAWDAPLEGRVALVMGSEGEGISRLVLSKCDFTCKLPQRGTIESLNVAQACTVLCYEWLRRSTQAAED